MPKEMTILEGYLPDFSGLATPTWVEFLVGQRERAAENYEFLQASDYTLDRNDYLEIFLEAADYPEQTSNLAKSICDIFAVRLALKLGFPLGIRFERYDYRLDRIVVAVPVTTVRNIMDRCGARRHRRIDGIDPNEFEPLWIDLAEARLDASEVAARCKRLLDENALGTLLSAFNDPRFEKIAMRQIVAEQRLRAFTDTIDVDRFRAATARRRREKYTSARMDP